MAEIPYHETTEVGEYFALHVHLASQQAVEELVDVAPALVH